MLGLGLIFLDVMQRSVAAERFGVPLKIQGSYILSCLGTFLESLFFRVCVRV